MSQVYVDVDVCRMEQELLECCDRLVLFVISLEAPITCDGSSNTRPRFSSRQIPHELLLDGATKDDKDEDGRDKIVLYSFHKAVMVSGEPLEETTDPVTQMRRQNAEKLQQLAGR